MKTRNTVKADVVDFLKKLGTGVAQMVAGNLVVNKVLPKVQVVGGKILAKMADAQGRKDADELERLAKQAEVSPPVAPTVKAEPQTPATVGPIVPDGPVEAKFQ